IQYLERALQIGETHENISLVVIASVWLAHIYRATGAWSEGQSLLDYVKKKVNPLSHPRLTGLIELHQVQLQRMQGMDKQVEAWVRKSKLEPTDEISFSMLDEYELLAYVLAKQGAL